MVDLAEVGADDRQRERLRLGDACGVQVGDASARCLISLAASRMQAI
jgi:uncharacterized cupin superfamily protein